MSTKTNMRTPNSRLAKIMRPREKTCVPIRVVLRFRELHSLNAGQKYCRMLQGEHSAILSTFIKLPFIIMIFVLSIFEWLFYTGFTVNHIELDVVRAPTTL